jgi:hypothetical protein
MILSDWIQNGMVKAETFKLAANALAWRKLRGG